MATDDQHMMKYALAIECSNPSARTGDRGDVALARIVEGGLEYVGSMKLSEAARGSDGLLVAIDALCAAHSVEPRQIGRVVVSVGPGGYTALRVSVTVAKVLGEALGCLVVAVPTAAVAAHAQKDVIGDRVAIIALASKGERTHCTRMCGDERLVLGVLDAVGVAGSGAGVLIGDGFVPRSVVEAAEGAGMEVRPMVLSARACLEVSGVFLAVEPEKLGVEYAREPDAVTQWRKLHG